MEPEVTAAVITVVLTSIMSTLLWLIQKRFDKKKDALNAQKTAAETDNVDSATIEKLANSVKTLQGLHQNLLIKYKEVYDSNILQAKEIAELTRIQENIVEQNKILLEENSRITESIRLVQKENESLREIVSSEQLDKRRLKLGIKKLIEQMKDNGITEPAFNL